MTKALRRIRILDLAPQPVIIFHIAGRIVDLVALSATPERVSLLNTPSAHFRTVAW
jgi:hypothetical protein